MRSAERDPRDRPLLGEPASGALPRLSLLPEMDVAGTPGALVASRAASIILWSFAGLLVAALALGFTLRMDVVVRAAGRIEPQGVRSVFMPVSGIVDTVLVRAGDPVRAGSLVARLDDSAVRDELAVAAANRRAREAGLEKARSTLPWTRVQRQQQLRQAEAGVMRARAALLQRVVEHQLGEGVDQVLRTYRPGTHVGLDLALADLRSAEAEVRSVQAQISLDQAASLDLRRLEAEIDELRAKEASLQRQIRLHQLHTPVDGVVLTDGLEQRAGATLREGERLLEIAPPGGWRVEMLVREADVDRIRTGDRVRLEVAALHGAHSAQMDARVTFVSPSAGSVEAKPTEPSGGRSSSAPQGYRVLAEVIRNEHAPPEGVVLRRGYTADARIITRRERIATLAWEYITKRS